MKRTIPFLLVICFSIFLVAFNTRNPEPTKAGIRTLVIDPGHGGDFPGARGTFSLEKNVSLAVALKFGKALEKEFPDLKIVYTRTTDANAGNKSSLKEDLQYRANLANESGGDLFISIHCNSAGRKAGGWYERVVTGRTPKTRYVTKNGKKVKQTYYVNKYKTVWKENVAQGTETYIWAVNKNDAKVSSINKNDDYNGDDAYYGEIDSTATFTLPDPSDPVERARMLVYAQNYFNKSYTLADFVEKEFASTGRTSRGVKQRNDAGIWVLQATGMPSILVEIGFISNKEEEEYINSDKGQDEIVEDLVNAFRLYKERMDSRAATTTATTTTVP